MADTGGFLKFNGGTLKAVATTDYFVANWAGLAVSVKANGAFFDTNGFRVLVGHGLSQDLSSTGGGVTKNGLGTLRLDTPLVHTFTGALTINAGTLSIGGQDGANHLSGNPNVLVNSGATLAFGGYAGFGTNLLSMPLVTVSPGGRLLSSNTATAFNNLTLNSGTMSINGNNAFGPYWGSFGLGGTTTATGNSFINVVSGNGTLVNCTGITPVFTVNTPAATDSLIVSAPITADIGEGLSLALVKQGLGSMTLTAANNYNNGTTVSGGTLIGTSTAALGSNSGLSIASSATFAYQAAGAGALDLGTGVLNLATGSRIGASLGGTLSQSAITSSAAAVAAGAHTVDVYGIPSGTTSTGIHNLITAGSGLTSGPATYALGNIYNAVDFTVTSALYALDTAVSVGVTSATAWTAEYWKGGFGGAPGVWAVSDGTAASNWASDAGGTATSLTPGATATITFSASGASNQGAMTLGANMSVAGIVVNNANPVTLNADANTLTLGASGVTVNGAAGAVTLHSNLTLGAAQIWTNSSSNPLSVGGAVANGGFLLTAAGSGNTAVSGGIGGSGGLTKADSGTLTLSGVNNYTGVTTVNGGTLEVSSGGLINSGNDVIAGLDGTTGSIHFDGGTMQNSRVLLGWGNGSNGTFQLDSGSVSATGASYVGIGDSAAIGQLNVTGGTLIIDAPLIVAAGGSQGHIHQSGGTIVVSGGIQVARDNAGGIGEITVSGGTLSQNSGTDFFFGGGTSNGTLNVSGTGTVNSGIGNMWIGLDDSTGTINISGGGRLFVPYATSFPFFDGINGTGIINLDGGTFALARDITRYGDNARGSGTLNFNGGTLEVATGYASDWGGIVAPTGYAGSAPVVAVVKGGGAIVDTNGQNALIGVPLTDGGGGGGFTKNGGGTLTLNGPDTYTGNTTVNAGTLQINNPNGNNSTSTVTIAARGLLNLNYAGTDVVNKLYIGATQQAAGVYGNTASGATNGGLGLGALDAYFVAGAGTLTVTTGPATDPYATWATTTNGLSGANAAFDADPDHDGIPNGVEFVIGGQPNPANPGSNSSSLLPTVASAGANLVFTYTRMNAAAYLNPVVEFNTGLSGTWTTAVDPGNSTIVVTPGATAATVVVTIPKGANPTMFARLRVTQP